MTIHNVYAGSMARFYDTICITIQNNKIYEAGKNIPVSHSLVRNLLAGLQQQRVFSQIGMTKLLCKDTLQCWCIVTNLKHHVISTLRMALKIYSEDSKKMY